MDPRGNREVLSRWYSNPPKMGNVEESGLGPIATASEQQPKTMPRRRMGKMFECAMEICTILDRFNVDASEGCYVRKFVEDLWQRPK